MFDYSKPKETVPDPINPIEPPRPPVWILDDVEPRPIMEMFKLDNDQEMALAMWDAAPAKQEPGLEPTGPGPEPIAQGGSGFDC